MTDVWSSRADAYRASPTHAGDPDLDLVVEMCEPRAGKKFLDVASGGGHVTRRLRERGAEVVYHDPFVADLAEESLDLASAPLTDELLAGADIVCVVTAHSGIDYARVAGRAQLVLDLRNAVPAADDRVVKL